MTTRRVAGCSAAVWMAVCFGCGPEIEDGAPPGQAAKVMVQDAAPLPPKFRNPNAAPVAYIEPAPGETPAAQPGAAPGASAPVAAAPAAGAAPSAPAANPAEPPPVSAEETADSIGIPAKPGAAGEREQATAGVGEKGRGYGGGIVTEPIHQYFSIQERLAFEDQIPHAMDLYKAEHNNRGPATHDLFMKLIIDANNIKLPELPPGDKYVYDPKQEQLMVEHPRK